MPRKEPQKLDSYVAQIKGWDWGYDLAANIEPARTEPKPYLDFRHLKIRGSLQLPETLAGEQIEITFNPSPSLPEVNQSDFRPKSVGVLFLEKEHKWAFVDMAADILPVLIPMLLADRMKYVFLIGTKPLRRKALIISYNIRTDFNEDALV